MGSGTWQTSGWWRLVKATFGTSVIIVTLVRAAAVFWLDGVNPWLFLAIDVVTAVPYAVAVPRTFEEIFRRPRRPFRLTGWFLTALLSFAAPYLYVLLAAGRSMPSWVLTVILGWVTVVLTGIIWSNIRSRRAG
ncbi:hypothetical protein JNJ66_01480 [Candidatus Saccharibacteria bacterium]|nr:hypothetical protein [Candidatus Saccharibacteria bacterium]